MNKGKRTSRAIVWTTAVLWVVVAALPGLASGQTTDTALQELQKQVDRAKLQADLAQYQQTKAEAEANAFKAMLGGLTTKGPEGIAKLDNVTIEANYLAYCAAGEAAKNLVAQADPSEHCARNVVFFTQKEQDALQSLRTLKEQLKQLSDSVDNISQPLLLVKVPATVLLAVLWEGKELYKFEEADKCVISTAPPEEREVAARVAPAAIFAAIDVGLGVISLFKTDTEINGVAITPDELALQVLVIHELREQCKERPEFKVVHPAYFYTSVVSTPGSVVDSLKNLASAQVKIDMRADLLDSKVKQSLVAAIEALKKANSQLAQNLAEIRDIEMKLKSPTLGADDKAKLQRKKKELQDQDDGIGKDMLTRFASCVPPASCTEACVLDRLLRIYLSNQARTESRIANLKAISLKISELNKSMNTPDTNGVTPLQTILRIEAFEKAASDKANLLVTKFVTIGGNNITKKNLFSTEISFSGGAIAEYVLLGPDGVIKNAGVVQKYGSRLKESDFARAAAARCVSAEADRGKNGKAHNNGIP